MPARKLQPGWYDHRALEASVLRKWREERVYQQVKHANERGEVYYFLDGPPFTTGGIHLGTAYNKVLKDVQLRHLRMQGYNVWDRSGFDVHGLPVEVAVERLLNLSGAEQIENYGVDKFVQSCRTNVKDSINKMIREFSELGVWLDFENPYIPATREYIQSAWWTFKRALESGSLTRQRRILTWCPRCETAVGGAEVQRRMSTLASAYIKIPLKDRPNEFIVVWTNQVWTLPMAVAVAVNPDAKYVKAVVRTQEGVEKLIILESTIARLLFKAGFTKYEREATLTGRDLVGERITHPLLAEVPQQRDLEGEWVHRIIASDYVKEVRTGAIYVAPGVCAPDWDISVEFKLPILSPIDREGKFLPEFSPKYGGFRAAEAAPMVMRDVQTAGLMLFEAQEKHPVKSCWRCDAPLMQRFDEEWFLNINAVKPHMLAEVKAISWMPEHLGSTQIREWIEKATEWCVSRRRFWGTPIPFWRCIAEGCGGYLVLDRVDDLRRAKGYKDGVDVHLPDIDRLTFPCPKCGADMYRAPQVLDVWFDAGIASWASLGYPAREDLFRTFWPPRSVIEGEDQGKGWFYAQLALSVLVFDRAPFAGAVSHGYLMDQKSQRLSRVSQNPVFPSKLVQEYGADALRLGLLLHGAALRRQTYSESHIKKARKVLNTLWNASAFLRIARDNSDFTPDTVTVESIASEMTGEDKWVLSRLEGVKAGVREALATFSLHEAAQAICDFIERDLSSLYLKSARGRVRVDDDTADKLAALRVLHDVMVSLAELLAPFTPFISERIYEGMELRAVSVHAARYPAPNMLLRNQDMEARMAAVLGAVKAVVRARRAQNIYLRWPLKRIVVKAKDRATFEALAMFERSLLALTNSKSIEWVEPEQDWKEMILEVRPNPNAIGKVYRQWASKISAMMKFQPAKKIKEGIEKGEYILGVEGQVVRILPNMVDFASRLPDEVVEEQCEAGTIYVDLNVTDATRKIGMAVEVARRIQQMRKELKLSYGDFIETFISTTDVIKAVLTDGLGALKETTRSRAITFTQKPQGDYIVEWVLFAEPVTIGITPLHFDKVVRTFSVIPGMSPKRTKSLFQAGFTTPDSLHAATMDQLEAVPGLGKSTARKIRRFLDQLEQRGERLAWMQEEPEEEAPEPGAAVDRTQEKEISLPSGLAPETAEAAFEPTGTPVDRIQTAFAAGPVPAGVSANFFNELAGVPGVGPSKARIIVDAGYRDLASLAQARAEELESLPRVGRAVARAIFQWVQERAARESGLAARLGAPAPVAPPPLLPAAGPSVASGSSAAPPQSPPAQRPRPAPATAAPVVAGEPVIDEDITSAVEAIVSEAEAKGTAAPLESVKVSEGLTFMVLGRGGGEPLKLFLRSLQEGRPGIVLTSSAPEAIEAALKEHSTPVKNLESTPFVWLSENPHPKAIPPGDLERLTVAVQQFLASSPKGVVLVDNVEALVATSRFVTVLRFLTTIKDQASAKKASLLIGVSPGRIEDKQVRIIEAEVDRVVT